MFPLIEAINQKLSEKEVKVQLLKPIVLTDSDQEHDLGDSDLQFSIPGDKDKKRVHYEGFSVTFSM